MATINILVVVDVEGATSSGNLASNVWMIDTGKYLGTVEAGNELITYANNGDKLQWSLAAVDPGTNLAFAPYSANPPSPFSGQAVPANINPQPVPLTNNTQYIAQFSVPGGTKAGAQYQYRMTLAMDGKNYTFDPFLQLFTST